MRSKLKRISRFIKIGKRVLIALVVIFAYFYISLSAPSKDQTWGITFSPQYAESLDLDWKETYQAILDELKVDNLRLVAYWDILEPVDNQYDFQSLDYQIQEASVRDAKILLALGRRLPRWPECHIPDWAKSLSEEEQQAKLLEFLPLVIDRYKDKTNIVMWQVENEFFLRNFGICPKADSQLLDKELEIVRSLDQRPIVLTDSGELGGWWGAISRADVFGTTMYRIIYNKMLGYATYPLKPIYYKRRFLLYKPFFKVQDIINVELQAEPWARTNLREDPLELQYITLSPEKFRKNIEYARASGISTTYLWGAEWWYFLKVKKEKVEIWDEAKKLWEN